MKPEVKERLDQEVKSHKVVLYMKGNALFPRCGFSAAALAALQAFAHCVIDLCRGFRPQVPGSPL